MLKSSRYWCSSSTKKLIKLAAASLSVFNNNANKNMMVYLNKDIDGNSEIVQLFQKIKKLPAFEVFCKIHNENLNDFSNEILQFEDCLLLFLKMICVVTQEEKEVDSLLCLMDQIMTFIFSCIKRDIKEYQAGNKTNDNYLILKKYKCLLMDFLVLTKFSQIESHQLKRVFVNDVVGYSRNKENSHNTEVLPPSLIEQVSSLCLQLQEPCNIATKSSFFSNFKSSKTVMSNFGSTAHYMEVFFACVENIFTEPNEYLSEICSECVVHCLEIARFVAITVEAENLCSVLWSCYDIVELCSKNSERGAESLITFNQLIPLITETVLYIINTKLVISSSGFLTCDSGRLLQGQLISFDCPDTGSSLHAVQMRLENDISSTYHGLLNFLVDVAASISGAGEEISSTGKNSKIVLGALFETLSHFCRYYHPCSDSQLYDSGDNKSLLAAVVAAGRYVMHPKWLECDGLPNGGNPQLAALVSVTAQMRCFRIEQQGNDSSKKIKYRGSLSSDATVEIDLQQLEVFNKLRRFMRHCSEGEEALQIIEGVQYEPMFVCELLEMMLKSVTSNIFSDEPADHSPKNTIGAENDAFIEGIVRDVHALLRQVVDYRFRPDAMFGFYQSRDHRLLVEDLISDTYSEDVASTHAFYRPQSSDETEIDRDAENGNLDYKTTTTSSGSINKLVISEPQLVPAEYIYYYKRAHALAIRLLTKLGSLTAAYKIVLNHRAFYTKNNTSVDSDDVIDPITRLSKVARNIRERVFSAPIKDQELPVCPYLATVATSEFIAENAFNEGDVSIASVFTLRPLLRALAVRGDDRCLNLVELITLYCDNQLSIECIDLLFVMCEKANDAQRARELLALLVSRTGGTSHKINFSLSNGEQRNLDPTIPGYLAKCSSRVIKALRVLGIIDQ